MKTAVIITVCAATLSLAFPASILPKDSNDNRIRRNPVHYVDGLAVGFVTGVVAGFYATILGQDMEDDSLKENRYGRGFWDGYELGRSESWNLVELKHQELVECWTEKLEKHRYMALPDEPEDEFEERMWSLCRADKDMDVFQAAFILGPRKTGLRYFYRLPLWSSRPNELGKHAQKQDEIEEQPPEPPKGEGKQRETDGGHPMLSKFSAVKNTLVSKAKQFAHNVKHVTSAAIQSKPHPSTGFFGGRPSSGGGLLGGTKAPVF